MPAFITFRRVLVAALILALLASAAVAQSFRLFERAWFWATEARYAEQWRERSLWLPDYQVTLEAKPIEGVAKNLSALTYDPQRRSLFSVTNAGPASLLELSREGVLLRRIELRGFQDPEAIEYVAPGRFVIAEERYQKLIEVQVADDTTVIDATDGQHLSIGIDTNGNKGFEGLAYDAEGHRLFVAKERDPVRIYEVTGFPHMASAAEPRAIEVSQDVDRDAGLFVRDLSSLSYDQPTGHLLALSDESYLLLELDRDGKPVSSLSLLRGRHGLAASVPQAEGVVVDDAGVLYMISEPNLFYRFEKKALEGG